MGSKEGRAMRARRQFTDEFKAGAVRLVLDEGKTIAAVARDLGLTASEKRLAKATKRVTNATSLLIEAPSDAETRRLRDEARADMQRIKGQLAEVAAPVTLPSTDAILGGLRGLLDLLTDKPEVGHAALMRCGLRLRVTVRPHGPHRFWLVGSLDLGAVSGSGGGSAYGLNGCSSLPRTGFASRRATASCSSLVSRRT
ncbi:MAG: transposase [Kofleriaceae bacterium]|nr:transposase [Kofleriaceae bacterium]